MSASTLALIPLLPLACAVVNALVGMRLPRRFAQTLAVAGVAAAAILTLFAWPLAAGGGTRVTLYTWLASGPLNVPVTFLFDRLSAPMTLMVTSVSTIIHLYAVGYMKEDEDYARFFALLNFFVFAMLTIVLADSLLLLFLGWEGVGFSSYALIGFWYRDEKNADAGRKAFLVTRIGDVFFGIAILWLFRLLHTTSIDVINAQAGTLAPATITALVLLLLAGACGKSAQLPLMTWLPDAMAGPTPVSALIHAATMVTAGVYLLCRLFPLVSLSATGMAAIATVGALSALYAATCAIAQDDIKRVLAYSTMSQVGYMFLAVGVGSVAGAMFHLFIHAFFKSLLFMGAGCIIHLYGGDQNIFRMGGLVRKAPAVFWPFLVAALCLAGAPLTGGFFSKDGILTSAFAAGGYDRLLWGVGLLAAFLTAFYTFRLVFLVFAGSPRQRLHEGRLPKLMVWTLYPLAALALFGGLLDLPSLWGGGAALSSYLGPYAGLPHDAGVTTEWVLTAAAVLLFIAGWLLAAWRYSPYRGTETGTLHTFLHNGWEADSLFAVLLVAPFTRLADFFWKGIDVAVIDGVLHGAAGTCQRTGEQLRRATTGRVSSYVIACSLGLLLVLAWFLLQLTM